MVVTVRTGGKLRHGSESRIRRLRIGKRHEAPLTDRLIAVPLRQIRLIYSTGADVLCVDASRGSQFMLQTKTPLHEIRRMKFSILYRRDGDWGKTSCGIRLFRRAGKLALRKSPAEGLICSHGCVNRTVRNSRRNRRTADSAKKATLERFDVGWIDTDHIGDAAGQNVTENAEASTQHGLGLKLPCDRCSRLQDRQGRRGKHVTETRLNRGVQRLIHIMRDRIERAAQTSDMLMRIQRVGVKSVPYPERPRQLPGHFPGVLRIQVEIQEAKGFVCRRGKSLCCRGCDSINVLRQGSVSHSWDGSLAEVIVIEPKNPSIGSKTQLVCPSAPGEVVIDEDPGGASSLNPSVVKSPDTGKRRIRAATLQNDRERGERFLKIARTKQASIPGKGRVEIIHEILRKDVRISCCKRVQGLRRKSVEQRIDGIGVGSLESVVRLKAKPGGVFLIDVVIDPKSLDLFMIIARMRHALAICATVSIIRNCGQTSTNIERTAKYGEWCSAGSSIE